MVTRVNIEPGSWAEWAGAASATAAFGLGVLILALDRRRDRRKEAASVVAWDVNTAAGPVEVTVANNGDRPVRDMSITIPAADVPGEPPRIYIRPLASVLRPGEEITNSYPWEIYRVGSRRQPYIRFMDSTGTNWHRAVRSGRLRKAKDPLAFNPRRFVGAVRRRKTINYLRAVAGRRRLPPR